jgi:hypothetical protein
MMNETDIIALSRDRETENSWLGGSGSFSRVSVQLYLFEDTALRKILHDFCFYFAQAQLAKAKTDKDNAMKQIEQVQTASKKNLDQVQAKLDNASKQLDAAKAELKVNIFEHYQLTEEVNSHKADL